MLLTCAAIGILAGALAGGTFGALINVRLRYAALLFAALLVHLATQFALSRDVPYTHALLLPLSAVEFGCLLIALWLNRTLPGLLAVLVGVAANAVALLANGGLMPVYGPAIAAAGLGSSGASSMYVPLPTELGLPFLLHAGPFADVIPLPIPALANVISIGDVLIGLGLAWFAFATMVHGDPTPEPRA